MTRLGKSILVLGAQGLLGRFVAQALRDAGHHVWRAGRRNEACPDFRFVDLDQIKTLRSAWQDVDLVVSTIEDPAVRAELEILHVGGTLLSLATLPASARRRLQESARHAPRGRVVLNAGLSGAACLVARGLVEEFPAADAVEIAYVISISGSAGLAGARYAHRVLVGQPRHPTQRRLFSAPRGTYECLDVTDGPEIWMSPDAAGSRPVRAYLAIGERWANDFVLLLNRTAMLGWLPEAAVTLRPRMTSRGALLSREPMRGRAAVYANGALLAARGVEASGDYHSTARSAQVFVRALTDANVPRGVHAVEDLFRFSDLRDHLAAQQIIVRDLSS